MQDKINIIEGIDCSRYDDCTYHKQCKHLKQTLEEIRELLGSACVNDVHCDSEELIKCKEPLCDIGKAKTLIDEVLNEK